MITRFCLLLVAALAMPGAIAQPDCSVPAQAKNTALGVDSFLENYFKENRQKKAAHDRKVDELVGKLVAKGKWTAEQKAPFFVNIIKSDEFQRLESEKMAEMALFNTATQNMLAQREKQDFVKACVNVFELARSIKKMSALNDTQYEMMLDRISSMAKAKGV